jgi:hypothetical protein
MLLFNFYCFMNKLFNLVFLNHKLNTKMYQEKILSFIGSTIVWTLEKFMPSWLLSLAIQRDSFAVGFRPPWRWPSRDRWVSRLVQVGEFLWKGTDNQRLRPVFFLNSPKGRRRIMQFIDSHMDLACIQGSVGLFVVCNTFLHVILRSWGLEEMAHCVSLDGRSVAVWQVWVWCALL